MHTIDWWQSDEHGVHCFMQVRNCLHGLDKHGNIIKILYCSRDGHFFVRKRDGWRERKPLDVNLRKKRAGLPLRPAAGGCADVPQMVDFGAQTCHKLMAFVWCKRPKCVIVEGKEHRCYMDYKRGRMYYRTILRDAHGKEVRDKNGNRTLIRVYLQVDHLNTNHADFLPGNLEHITAQENIRRRTVCAWLRMAGLDPKKMPYKLLRNFFKDDGMLNRRILLVMRFFGDQFKLERKPKNG